MQSSKGKLCSCGQRHAVSQSQVQIGPGILDALDSIIPSLQIGQSCCLICDQITYQVAGEKVLQKLKAAGKEVELLKFERAEPLVPDEITLGELSLSLSTRPQFLVGVGSGTISDLTRYAAFIVGIPYLLVATAPSMDGYSSAVAPLIRKGAKYTYTAKEPTAILADSSVLAQAPQEMIQAGVGDLLGKYVARADWELSHLLTGEDRCPKIQKTVDQALELCVSKMRTIPIASPEFADVLMRGLILSGQAITIFGSSRPASGAEHHLAHYWRKLALQEGAEIGLHGQKVGCSARLILQVYHLVAQRMEKTGEGELKSKFFQVMEKLPSVEWYDQLLSQAGISFAPEKIGIRRDWLESGLLTAMNYRDRYSILKFAHEQGWLEAVVLEIMGKRS